MCGIIGILTKNNNLKELIFNCLHRLSYRGYDSSGFISFKNREREFDIYKSIGDIENLEKKIENSDFSFKNKNSIGLAHTRWATHGEVKEENTHPLIGGISCAVHNGIVENYHEIKNKLIKDGYKFCSGTDTELIPVLIQKFLDKGFEKLQSISETFKILRGTFAVGILFEDEPTRIYAYKNGSPLVFSFSEDEKVFCISSDIFSISLASDFFIKINDGEILIIDEEKKFNNKNYIFYDSKTLNILEKKNINQIEKSNVDSASKEGFESYMMKEIFEQPKVISETLGGLYEASNDKFFIDEFFSEINLISVLKIIGCGSSNISGNIGSYYLKKISLINAFTESASEVRYSGDPIGIYDAMIFISQSGETADVLASIHQIKSVCSKTIIALTNNPYSSLASLSDFNFFTKAGQEISVASTKTFTTQIAVFIYLSIYFAKIKNLLNENESRNLMTRLISSSRKINKLLNDCRYLSEIKENAKIISKQKNIIFIGREIYFHIASEGSLKLKELSYISSESLFAGELKHGPLALIDENSYIVVMCPENELYEKNIVTIEEILSRHANLIILTDTKKTEEYFKNNSKIKIIFIDEENDFISSPFLFTTSVQLLAYYAAKELGRNIDKPRNLAKSVTVE